MKTILRTIGICGLFLGIISFAFQVQALTCKRMNFEEKVKTADNVIVGTIIKVDKGKRTVRVRIDTMLKVKTYRTRRSLTFDVHLSRYTNFSFDAAPGQVVMFFFHSPNPTWTCSGPILLKK